MCELEIYCFVLRRCFDIINVVFCTYFLALLSRCSLFIVLCVGFFLLQSISYNHYYNGK